MRLAMLGCGYVANMYRLTLLMHPELELTGVFDLERSRAEEMSRRTGAKAYPSFDALLEDRTVPLVMNLTNPRVHFETTRALLEAGKHVYTEKPLAMRLDEARELVGLAERNGLTLASAPCTLMSPAAQTLWQAISEERAGPVRLVYAEMEDGMVPRAPVTKWINEAGVPWPAADEFETGCVIEHAAYDLTWLCAMFGPAESVFAFSDILLEDKLPGHDLIETPDFSVACIRFRSGVVARMTNGLYAEHDHRLRLFGDQGVLSVDDPRSDHSPVRLRRYQTLRRRRFLSPISRRLPLLGGRERISRYRGSQKRDFCRLIADMVSAINEDRLPYMGADFALHVTEVSLASQFGARLPGDDTCDASTAYRVVTDFAPLKPMQGAT